MVRCLRNAFDLEDSYERVNARRKLRKLGSALIGGQDARDGRGGLVNRPVA